MVTFNVTAVNRPETLSQKAYRSLRLAIQTGGLTQNQLYSEGELAKNMGISRTPVREALIELSRERMVEIVPQRGFRVRELSPAEQQEVFDLRRVLESFIAERVAHKVTDDQVGQLRRLVAKQRVVIDDPVEFITIDEQFHLLLPQLINMERTSEMLTTLRGAIWLIGSTALRLAERAEAILAEHTAIVDAIEARDGPAAAEAMRHHLQVSAEAVGAA